MPRKFVPSRLLQRCLARGLSVTQEELEAFRPEVLDVAIARAMQSGALSPPAIVEWLAENEKFPKVSLAAVRARLAEPLRAAWYNARVLDALPHLSAHVYWALLRRAFGGDTRAARLFLQRFDARYRPTTRTEMLKANVDVKVLSDDQIKLQLAQRLKELFAPAGAASDSTSSHAPPPAPEPDAAPAGDSEG